MAQLKNTTISDTGSLNLPAGTTAQRPASPAGGQIRYNTDINDTEYYDGAAWRPISDSNPEATGGTVVDTDIGGVPYRIHLFTNTGNTNFVVTKGGEVEYLVVAGGGGGGTDRNSGGGGGGGGVVIGTTTVTPQTYTVTVGAGGAGYLYSGATVNGNPGQTGNNSSAFGLTALGGGGGGGFRNNVPSGGSGGGAGNGSQSNATVNGATGTQPGSASGGFGNSGGSAFANSSSTVNASGGGGGAGSAGGNAPNGGPAGDGGIGIYSNITGIGQFYAGGGGGGARENGRAAGKGGLGGGSEGGFGINLPGRNSRNAQANSGGGAGGTGARSPGTQAGNGGSGIVVVRYRKNQTLITNPDKTIVSSVPGVTSPNRSEMFLLLDPGNPVCFTPGNTVCYNLITGGPVTGAADSPGSGSHTPNPANFPVYNSINGGVFDFIEGQGRGMNCEEDLGTRTELTFTMWFYRKGAGYFSDARNDGGQWFLSNYQSRNITYTNALAYNFNGPTTADYLADGPNFNDRWYHMAVVSNTSESKLYLNGIEVDQYVNNAPINMTFGKNFRIGNRFTTTGQWTGYMGLIYAHNRVLSPVEIYQSFTADRGRYGV